jgi:hypothetical protein
MTFNINELRSISKSSLSAIVAKDEKATNSNRFKDDRFWTPTRDAAGNGRALIRFLPALKQGELPWVEVWSYGIKGPGGWYIENSRRTINQPDPMAEYISSQWNEAKTEADKARLRAMGLSKARHTYIANILVINDPEHPENNGQVRLYRFGQKIYEMITDKAKPDPFDPSNGGVNVTDWDTGCNFKLIVYTKDRFPTYDKSTFNSQSSVGDDKTIVNIADRMYDLNEFIDPKQFKDYDTLKAQVNRVFGLAQPAPQKDTGVRTDGFESPVHQAPRVAPVAASTATSAISPTPSPVLEPVAPAPSTTGTDSKGGAPWESDDLNFDDLMKDL